MQAILAFGLAGLVTAFFVPLVKRFAIKTNVVDAPVEERKVHSTPKPLLGGFAIFFGFFIVLFGALVLFPEFFSSVPSLMYGALFFASTILMIGGYLDDKFNLSPLLQIIFPIVAAIIMIVSGIGVFEITNPYGGTIILGSSIAVGVAFLWLMGMMFTTKLLDGLDGLSTGVVLIGALMIFGLTQSVKFYQPEIGVITMIFAGALAGFLIFNFHPAKIFLGEGGSVLIGFILGVIAIISGSKIATTLLVVGIPALDVAWVIIHRIIKGKSITKGDSAHLHYRLLRKGVSHRLVVLLMYVLALGFGASTLFLQSSQKVIALVLLVVVMIGIGIYLVWGSSRTE